MRLVVDHIGGLCPVQAEGTVDGTPFYFRSRGDSWCFACSPDPVGTACGEEGFLRHGEWGVWPEAGYMPIEDAMAIIRACAAELTAENISDRM